MRRVALLLAASLVLGTLGFFVPQLAFAKTTYTIGTKAEKQEGAVQDERVFPLDQAAEHVALYWKGNPNASVQLAFSTDGVTFGPATPAGRDEAGEPGDTTYGAIQVARGAVAVKVLTDRPIAHLTVLGLSSAAPVAHTTMAQPLSRAATLQPSVISRDEWGADPSYLNWTPAFYPTKKVIVHHTEGTNSYTQADVPGILRSIYYYHAVTRGWGDIGYNFLIDRFGNVYEGRYSRDYGPGTYPSGDDADGNGVTGGHAYGWNSGTVGVSIMGSFMTTDITPEAREALVKLAAWEMSRNHLDPQAVQSYTSPMTGATIVTPNLAGHRDYGSTDCPGDVLYAQLPSIAADVAARIGASSGAATPLRVAATPLSGNYGKGTSIQLASSATAAIYYTTDGSTPTSSSTRYTKPIALSGTLNLRFLAVDGGQTSDVKSALYTYDGALPSIGVGSLTVQGTPAVGHTVYALPTGWSPGGVSFSYQWLVNGTEVPGATTSWYTPAKADFGATISVRATGWKSGYGSNTTTASTGPVIVIDRVWGQTMVDTAIALSQQAFPTTASTVYLATTTGFADALSGGGGAAHANGPLLLTTPDGLSAALIAELQRLQPSTIVIQGGRLAIPAAIESALKQYATNVVRNAGTDAIDTARLTAQRAFPTTAPAVFVATSQSFYDAMSAGPAAGLADAPILLTDPSGVRQSVLDAIAAMQPQQIYLLGGELALPAAIAAQLQVIAPVTRIAGQDALATSQQVNQALMTGANQVFLVTDASYYDGLSAGPSAAQLQGTVVLTNGSCIPAGSWGYIQSVDPSKVWLVGGTLATHPSLESLTVC